MHARQIRQKYYLQGILSEVNCNIGALTPRRLLMTLVPSLLGNTFVIKAHAAPTRTGLALIRSGLMRATYIYRDPRDAMLSVIENGQRALQAGRENAFSPFVKFEAALGFMLDYVHISESWLTCPQVLQTRYEDLLAEYDTETARLAAFLHLDRQAPAHQAVLEKYRPQPVQQEPGAGQRGLHFSKGKIGRFRQKFDAQGQAALADIFGDYLLRVCYPI